MLNVTNRMILMSFTGLSKEAANSLPNSIVNATHDYNPKSEEHSFGVHAVSAYEVIGETNPGTMAIVMLGLVNDDTDDGFKTFQLAQDLKKAFPEGVFNPLQHLLDLKTKRG